MMKNRAVRIALIVPAFFAGMALFSWFVMLLWNHALVPATGWQSVTYWQALGLLVLAKIFFGFGAGASGGDWRYRMRKRMERMTPEEREKFWEGMRARCGGLRASEPPQ
jgi:hypothetical protein